MEEQTSIPVITTTTTTSNQNQKTNSSKIREEGELTASENDEAAGSELRSSTILPGAPVNRDTSVAETGTSALTQNPTPTTATSRSSVHLNNRRSSEKKRVPFLISFSDEDSDSDSEYIEEGNEIDCDEMTKRSVQNRKFPTIFGNFQKGKQPAKTNSKIPKKVSTSRTFVSAANRANGTSSKNGGNTSIGPKSHINKSNAPSKVQFGQNVHVNSNKLQDLRQLIAIRESELKSKAGKLDKDVASSSLKNVTNMNVKSSGVRIRDSTERILIEAKEPDNKRLKVSEPLTSNRISVGQHETPPSESTLAAKNIGTRSDGLKSRYGGGYCDKEILGETGQSSAMQEIKEVKNHDIPLTIPPSGTDIIMNSRQHNNTNVAGLSVPSTAQTVQASPPRQGSLNSSSFLNHFGDTNISATGEMDMKSLLEIEELHDKELDEAQEYRRRCEIEERNALKAYRKAQRALAEANKRCSYLYKKRDVLAAKLSSHVMESSSMLWSSTPQQLTIANVNSVTKMSENNQVKNVFHLQSTDDVREDGKKLMSESSSEPDNSGSEPQEDERTNDVCSSLHENDNLAEDDYSLDSHGGGISSVKTKETTNDSVAVPTEDSLLLEATLRSQLFARLGVRTSKKYESGQSMEPATDEIEDGEIMEDSGNIPSSEAEKDQPYDFGDIGRPEKRIFEDPMSIDHQLNVENDFVIYGSSLAEPVIRSAFGHVKSTAMMNYVQSHTDDIGSDGVCGAQPTDVASSSKTYSSLDMYVNEAGSYSSNLAINPFWPLCMFELRGKCNDDECSWQHARDYSASTVGGATSVSNKCLGSLSLAPPTYLVLLDILKADSHPYKYLLAQPVEQRWQKYFSASLVVSSSILADLHSDEPSLHGPETRIEVHGLWNRQSSYFHGKNVREGLPDQQMDDAYQPLEMALLNLSREVNKQKGRTEALMVLARALEEHPKSVLLWIVYLYIYYCNQKSIGKDDMYRYAIEHNESSYELRLMFINSRDKLDDRLLAYKNAISALCSDASTPKSNPELDSECILDLFLQLVNCLCSSGEINNAIEKVYSFLSSTDRSTDLNPPFLPDLFKSLTNPDKHVLWICCIYLIMYKKLPDTIVQQFECQKELSAIEWNPVQLTPDLKQKAITLLELATEYIDSKSDQDTKTLKSAQLFALNHIKCTAVLEGSDQCKNVSKKYIQLYPSCLEIVLLSIRVNGFDSVESTYAAFEEAICNWVGEDGIQCIWNQYAEYALQNGRVDFAKEIMERWFSTIPEVHRPKSEILNISSWISSLTQTDTVFGLLNLSLHKQLQNEPSEARIAMEQVLEVASSDDYKHCVREHAVFLLKNGFGSGFGKASLHSFLNMLNRYLMDSRALPPPEPLSRSFIKSIVKPKVQKLVKNLLCPISSDSSLLNLVLASCYGPSLLPFQASEKPTDVVDFVEALMETRPANYQLALSVCKNNSDANASISFWASAQLIDSLFQAVPVAPEYVWVEAAGLLKQVAGFKSMLDSFHKRALSVYPYSLKLWKSYVGLYANDTGKADGVIEMAREKGIKL
ncbi:tetratricopeptide-like helical domain, zinc-finger domain protein [Artemisia annua]|uniref:Tetratricopeptide-like helical domain, zinc-finger domain protein n=2 Tax=Artemisia annua TaxID=35608 RepID=A0A2U1Q9F1_ARTAN|nr:tetratricopeptide-like helical domain, zinc-finger domain protein [Artemisia annua]